MITHHARYAFVLLLLLSSLGVAQQPAPPQLQPAQSPAVVSNNLQLVIDGKVTNVHDGDTVTVIDRNNRKFHIRLAGIDAPEIKQEFGPVSQQNLSRMVLGQDVSIFWSKVDRYGRTVGTIKIDGRDINIEQVKGGMAWHFKKYADEQDPVDRVTYAAAEEQARAAKLGLWQYENPMPPGDWRAGVKAKRWGPPPPEGTVIGNRGSMKYHRPDCVGYRDMAEKNRVFFTTVADAEAAGYKRAGNCPPADQIATVRPVSTTTPARPTPDTAPTATPAAAPAGTLTDSVTDEAEEVEVTAQTDPTETQAAGTSTNGNASLNGQQAAAPIPTNGTAAQVANSDGAVIGNKNSKVYHLPGCAGYTRVSEKNQVKFLSAADAEKAGYRIAGNCHPGDKETATAAPATAPATSPTVQPAATLTAPATETAPTALQPTPPNHITLDTPSIPAITPTAPANASAPSASSSNGPVIGNKNSQVYHLAGCPGYTTISEKNQVKFDSAADAEKAGYRLAGNCEPDKKPTGANPATSLAPETATSPTPETKPADVQPAASTPTTARPTAAAAESSATPPVSADAKVIGNKNSKVYHLPGCAGYTRVSEKNQVNFLSAADAEKAGYRLAGNCSANKTEKP